ncbi:PAP2-domain-containing protein [Suillus paluster]|uniref:PAP2-domain-containing protein n=1 Tax=Suillus paluster TaxID=48578 RepID=UPI001B869DD6|nr:PAP2-domain-containing protein [Suillus paluster]KAG1756553.1 PAP2-domain-containing protein [Suillus paluster]
MASLKFWNNSNYDRTTKQTDKKRRMSLIRSYAPDWTITILLAIVFFALDGVHGFRRGFSVNDETILFPFAVKERVPDIALYFIAAVAPLVIQLVVNLLTVRSFWDYHCSALGLILGLAITGAITQFTKITVGRPRPDLLSRCMPIPGSHDPTFGLSTDAICTNTDESIMIDGWRSFPSGHSSLSHAGLGFLSYYLAGKMHLFDTRGHTHKAWISVTPICGAILVAISRTMDYRHHWHDVVAGAILGLAVAYFAYRQYFPSLASPMSHKPHPPRVRREEELPTVNPATDRGQSYTDGIDEEVELVGDVRKPDPAFAERRGEYGVNGGEARI